MTYLNKTYLYACLIFLFSLPIAYAQPGTTYMDPSSAELWSITNSKLTPLHIAAAKGDLSEVNRLIQQKVNINGKDTNGHTPLHWAAYYGHKDCITSLMIHKAIVTKKGKQGETPLHIASFRGHLDAVKALSKDTKTCSIRDKYGHNPLQIAVQSSQPDCLKILLENGGNIHCKTKNGYTLLHLAAEANELTSIRNLISHGLDPNSRAKNQETALHAAAAAGHLPAINLLIESGANICSRDKIGQNPLHWAAKKGHASCIKILSKEGRIIDAQDRSGYPPLFFAVKNGYDACVKALVEGGADPNLFYYLHIAVRAKYPKCIPALVKAGANVNQLSSVGFRPLDIAISTDVDCVKMLIKMGANLDLRNECEYSNASPIYSTFHTYTADYSKVFFDSMMALIENGADLNTESIVQYDKWRTPLHKAAILKKFTAYIQPLIDGGADLTIQDFLGRTQLEVARSANNKTAISLLEDAVRIDQKHPMENGYTPLHRAIEANDVSLVKKLLKEGARVNQQEQKSIYRNRPLHMAVLNNNVAIIELLIEHGAYINAQNKEGSTPIFIAVLNNYQEAAAKLIEKGVDMDKMTPTLPGYTLLKIVNIGAAIQPKKDFSQLIRLLEKASKE